jgi:hypothetical protein
MNIYGKITSRQKSAIKYFADQLFTPQMKRNVSIRVTLTQKMENFGETEVTDYNISGKPREFNIIIKKDIGDKEIIRTISHEMVHVKQYTYNELNESMTMWCGKSVDEDQYDYFNSPWEIEAHELGDKLYESFI